MAQDLREKIDQHYRVRLILDNLPITTYDLAENPESIRPGYEVGYERDGKYYINNHLMFKILVHKTNGQYTRARENMAEIEAAAVIEVRHARMRCSPCVLALPCSCSLSPGEAWRTACRQAALLRRTVELRAQGPAIWRRQAHGEQGHREELAGSINVWADCREQVPGGGKARCQ